MGEIEEEEGRLGGKCQYYCGADRPDGRCVKSILRIAPLAERSLTN